MATIEEIKEKLKQWKWQQPIWNDGSIICPQCGSSNLTGEGQGEPVELPDPEHEGEVIEGWQVVQFTCTVCQHQWTDGEPGEAEKMQQAGLPGLFAESHG